MQNKLNHTVSAIKRALKGEDMAEASSLLNDWVMDFPISDEPNESLLYNYYRLKYDLHDVDLTVADLIGETWLRALIDFANDYFFLNAEAGYPHADKAKEIHGILTEDLQCLDSGYFEHLIPLLHNPEESVEELLIELNLPKQHPALRKHGPLPPSGSKKE